MKKTVKMIGIGGLIGALALAVADNHHLRTELRTISWEKKRMDKMWEKEMRSRIKWKSIASNYRWHRGFFGLEYLDKQYDERRDEMLKENTL